MQHRINHISYLLPAIAVALVLASGVTQAKSDKEDKTYKSSSAGWSDSESGKMREGKAGLQLHKANQLIGMDVKNPAGENLGNVEEIVLSPQRDRIAYYVLSFGGFMGVGDKFFAIPWEAAQLSAQRDHIILDVDKQKLQSAPGFDKNNWPDMGNPEYMSRVSGFYGKESAHYRERTNFDSQAASQQPVLEAGQSDRYRADRDAEWRREDRQQLGGRDRWDQQAQRDTMQPFWTRKLSQVIGLNVQNYRGQDLGEIEDLMVDVAQGRIAYALVSTGNFMDRKLAAVPWSAVDLHPQQGLAQINADQQLLDSIAFNESQMPNLSDEAYGRRLYSQFDQEPYWEVFGYVSPRGAAGSDAEAFNAQNILTIEGTVQSVGSYHDAGQQGIRLRVQADDEQTYTCHLGPQQYLSQKGLTFHYGDEVTITGSKARYEGRPVLIATEVEMDDKTIQLRNSQGQPMWRQDQ